MKKHLRRKTVLTAACGMAILLMGMPAAAEEVTATGSAPGIEGEAVVVEVTATPDKLVSVTVVENHETDGIGSVACEQLPAAMILPALRLRNRQLLQKLPRTRSLQLM